MGLWIRRDARNGDDRLRFVTVLVTAADFRGAVGGLSDWSRSPDLNWGPTDYESVALPTELLRLASEGNGSVESGRSGVKFLRSLDRIRDPTRQRAETSTSISDACSAGRAASASGCWALSCLSRTIPASTAPPGAPTGAKTRPRTNSRSAGWTGCASRVRTEVTRPSASRVTRSEERRVGEECRSRW